MTYLTESRDALAKALYVYAHREGRAERVRAWESDTIPRPMKDQRREWADALIASGAVIPADTLADDEALRHRLADRIALRFEGEGEAWPGGDHLATVAADIAARVFARALAAFTERGDRS